MSVFDGEPGNMVLVQGDEETKTWLRTQNGRVDDWLYELVDLLVFYAQDRLRMHAPGRIKELVGVLPAHETATGAFEGIAGVEPDITEETFGRGLGSDPADYPVFVDVGTGIYGPVGEPISTIPGHLMGPIPDVLGGTGGFIYVQTIKGQRPQDFSGQSARDLIERTPVMIHEHLPELGRRT